MGGIERIELGGVPVDLIDRTAAIDAIMQIAAGDDPTLNVVSVNLDHVHHFGTGGRWHGCLDHDGAWLHLIDGAPIAAAATRRTGTRWPRLAGSDLAADLLQRCAADGCSVGFVGGSTDTQSLLAARLAADYPDLRVAGMWSPDRNELSDRAASQSLATAIKAVSVDVLFVGLGKPRQELWMTAVGPDTGARVLLAFGAAVDFLAGRVERAPKWVRRTGIEWAWRLALEPRRLANRYLVQGPAALARLCASAPPALRDPPILASTPAAAGRLGVVVVTYQSADTIGALLDDLHAQLAGSGAQVVVVDNASSDATADIVAASAPWARLVNAGGNVGYAAAVNLGFDHCDDDITAVAVLNPDLRLRPRCFDRLLERLGHGAAVAVPLVVDEEGATYPSLQREPTVLRAIGDALFGARMLRNRPSWACGVDHDEESYSTAHPVDWATGAALVIRRDVAALVGPWDESFFLYSEETDFCHRVRAGGEQIWFEPSAVVEHRGGASGSSRQLDALLAVNRIRYVRMRRPRWYAAAFRVTVMLHHALRATDGDERYVLAVVADEQRWSDLPGPTTTAPDQPHGGSVIVPAHNEAAVLARLLGVLAPLADSGVIELVVACNGCSDGTADVARDAAAAAVVLDLPTPSKPAALNAADHVATRWPRLYVDADIEVSADAILATLEQLHRGVQQAARPAFRYDTSGASWPVRAYIRARRRLPSTRNALWGAGIYGVSADGHAAIAPFPDIIGDDLYVDTCFAPADKAIVPTAPVVVRTPRRLGALVSVLARAQRGRMTAPDQKTVAQPDRSIVWELVGSVRTPRQFADASVYAALAVAARVASRRRSSRWERDDTTR